MKRRIATLVTAVCLAALVPAGVGATTREIAELSPARLTFGQSILNQLSFGSYREPFDELQGRPYNLLFTNIGRHSVLTPWPGQQGNYTRYFNALIGNNGVANIDNDSDSIQGALVRRQRAGLAWGLSAALVNGSNGSDDTIGTTTFIDTDDLTGIDLRGATAIQLNDSRVLGAGIRLTQAASETGDSSFEPGVGGFVGADEFNQFGVLFDAGLRQFRNPRSSWEAQVVLGFGTSEQDEFSETLDDTGAVTDRFVITRYDIGDLSLGLHGGYNKLKTEAVGETEYRGGLTWSQRELNNSDLSFGESALGVTPSLTLVGQDAITTTELYGSARSIFQAGETEMFVGARLDYRMVDGATQVDAAGIPVNEAIDDSTVHLGLIVGLRQPFFADRLRFIVSGRADLLDEQRRTLFETATEGEDLTRSTSQYAIGLEGVLANVTFDIAWLTGEEAPVVPVALGLPTGSRRSIEVDRLVFSAAVAW